MCLSSVYRDKKSDDTLVIRDATQVTDTGAGVDVSTLFGESTSVDGYGVGELNLIDNYIILKPKASVGHG